MVKLTRQDEFGRIWSAEADTLDDAVAGLERITMLLLDTATGKISMMPTVPPIDNPPAAETFGRKPRDPTAGFADNQPGQKAGWIAGANEVGAAQ